MTNPLIKKVPNAHAGYLILICLGAGMLILWAMQYVNEQPITSSSNIESRTVSVAKALVQTAPRTSGKVVRVTWFGPECHTKWCREHIGGEREQVVAVNYKMFGKPKSVYIPKWGKTYPVISNTDGLTPIDVWCDTDTSCQESVAQAKQVSVNFNY